MMNKVSAKKMIFVCDHWQITLISWLKKWVIYIYQNTIHVYGSPVHFYVCIFNTKPVQVLGDNDLHLWTRFKGRVFCLTLERNCCSRPLGNDLVRGSDKTYLPENSFHKCFVKKCFIKSLLSNWKTLEVYFIYSQSRNVNSKMNGNWFCPTFRYK